MKKLFMYRSAVLVFMTLVSYLSLYAQGLPQGIKMSEVDGKKIGFLLTDGAYLFSSCYVQGNKCYKKENFSAELYPSSRNKYTIAEASAPQGDNGLSLHILADKITLYSIGGNRLYFYSEFSWGYVDMDDWRLKTMLKTKPELESLIGKPLPDLSSYYADNTEKFERHHNEYKMFLAEAKLKEEREHFQKDSTDFSLYTKIGKENYIRISNLKYGSILGGMQVSFSVENFSPLRIKYITFIGEFRNDVDDICSSKQEGTVWKRKMVGPLEPFAQNVEKYRKFPHAHHKDVVFDGTKLFFTEDATNFWIKSAIIEPFDGVPITVRPLMK